MTAFEQLPGWFRTLLLPGSQDVHTARGISILRFLAGTGYMPLVSPAPYLSQTPNTSRAVQIHHPRRAIQHNPWLVSHRSQTPALQSHGSRATRGQVVVVGYDDGGEPVR